MRVCFRSQHFQIVLQSVNPALRDRYVILLGHMDVSMAHLVAKKMRWCVQDSQLCAVSVPEEVILEVDAVLFLQFPGRILHAVDRLHMPVW